MKRISLIMGIIFLLLYVNTAYGKSVKPVKEKPGCQKNLEMCTEDLDICDTDLAACEAAGAFGVPQTGQTTCWDSSGTGIACAGTGQDGDIQAGVVPPNPRFTDNGNGTITDNLTGLIWLKNANCFCFTTWAIALTDANTLNSGECGLTDGSVEGDWYLPNVREFYSLFNFEFSVPALSNAAGTAQWTEGDAFTNVISTNYWSSTTRVVGPGFAWVVDFGNGNVNGNNKTFIGGHVLPVRGGS